mgnify:CR=1 FL=1
MTKIHIILHELEVIQNRILIIIFNLPFRIHTKDHYIHVFTQIKPITVCIYRYIRNNRLCGPHPYMFHLFVVTNIHLIKNTVKLLNNGHLWGK